MPRKLFCVSGASWSGADVKVRSALPFPTAFLSNASMIEVSEAKYLALLGVWFLVQVS